jgi:predicted ArsR family transcriptional regulator
MPEIQSNSRFFASTRGRIVMLLRRASHTVDELANELNLTDNAVRAHLVTLERDGIVQQRGIRRGSGKPALVYELATGGEQLFPKAYEPVLQQLLGVLSERMALEEMETLLSEVGCRIAAHWNIPPGNLAMRLEAAVEVLNELGGMAELETGDGHYCIRGYSCPLASVVPGHPEVCQLAETLLTELVGVTVEEHCNRSKKVQCCFTVATSTTTLQENKLADR